MTVAPSRTFAASRTRTRNVGTRKQRARVLIVSGGKVTEVEYLNYVKSALRASGIDIRVDGDGRSPLHLAKKAEKLKAADLKEARNSGDSSNVFDSVWVVSDVDNFGADLVSAIAACKTSGIETAISNPCFELWLLLHQKNQSANITTRAIQSKAEIVGVTVADRSKSISLSKLSGKFEVASLAATRLRKMHADDRKRHPHDNPSTTVDLLVKYLIDTANASSRGKFDHEL